MQLRYLKLGSDEEQFCILIKTREVAHCKQFDTVCIDWLEYSSYPVQTICDKNNQVVVLSDMYDASLLKRNYI